MSGVDRSEAEFLADYDLRAYPPVAVAVDLALLTVRDARLCVLLVRRAGHPERGHWALPGGFLEPTESADQAAARELAEETGLDVDPWHMEQLGTYTDPRRDPRGPGGRHPDGRIISVAYLVFAPEGRQPTAASDAADARWWDVDDLDLDGTSGDGPVLAFDHGQIITDGIVRCRAKLEYTTLAATFLAEPFTMGDLRRVYEAVWGVRLHPSNFNRKVMATDGFVFAADPPAPSRRVSGPPQGNRRVLYRRGPASVVEPPLARPAKDEVAL